MSLRGQTEWDRVPADPDPHRDLEYQMVEMDVIDCEQAGKLLVLPCEEDMLREDAFVIADEEMVCDPSKWT